MSFHELATWLSHTSISETFQNVLWIIPTTQCVHIVCIAIVVGSTLMVDFNILGILGRDRPTDAIARRFLPWVWWSLLVLLITGTILAVAEPGRSIVNPTFQIKMLMVTCLALLLLAFQLPMRGDPTFWERGGASRMALAKFSAVLSLAVVIAIVFAGRWIAYTISAGDTTS